MNEYRRRGRPPKDYIEYTTNLAINEKLRQRRQEIATEIERLKAEVETELTQYCLNCKQPCCKSGSCQEIHQEKKRLLKEKKITQLQAQIHLLYNTKPPTYKKTSPKAK